MQHAKSVRGVKLILMGPPLPEKWPEQCRTLICSRLMRFDRYFWKGEPKMKKIISAVLTLIMSFSVFAFAQTTEAAPCSRRPGIVSTSSGRLNIRSQASTGSAVVASLDKGSYVTLAFQIRFLVVCGVCGRKIWLLSCGLYQNRIRQCRCRSYTVGKSECPKRSRNILRRG